MARAAKRPDDVVFDADFERKLEGLALVARRLFEGRIRAERKSRRTGGGIEFADHREYAPGDDFRFVNARLYGRTGKLFVKLFEEEEDLVVHLLLDASRSMDAPLAADAPSKLIVAQRVAAALAFIALTGLDRVSVTTMRGGTIDTLPAARGRGRIHAILDRLRAISTSEREPPRGDRHTDLDAAARAFTTRTKQRGLAILISDLYDPAGLEPAVERLRHARFEVVVVELWDPREARRLGTGELQLEDSETGELRQITLTDALLTRFDEARAQARRRRAAYCREKQVLYVDVSIDVPWDESVLEVLARGGLVA